jgi:hypothetical protein
MSSAFVMHTTGRVENRNGEWFLVLTRQGKDLVSFFVDTVEPKMPVTLSIVVGHPVRVLPGPNPANTKEPSRIDPNAGKY